MDADANFTMICKPCKKKFGYLCALEVHVNQVHPGVEGIQITHGAKIRFWCPVKDVPGLPDAPGMRFQCDKCEMCYNSKNDIILHRMTNHESTPITAPTGDVWMNGNPYNPKPPAGSTPGPDLKTLNVLNFKSQEFWQSTNHCDNCGMRFATQDDLKDHVGQLHGERWHKCNLCQYVAWSLFEVTMHIRQYHCKMTDYKCDICWTEFVTTGQAVNHVRYQHTADDLITYDHVEEFFDDIMASVEAKFYCDKCFKPFDDKDELDVHADTHNYDNIDWSFLKIDVTEMSDFNLV